VSVKRLLLIAIVLVPLSAAGNGASALAASLRALASPVTSFSSDGRRDVAWQASESAPVVVLDTRTGVRRTLAAPAGCRLADQGEGSSDVPTFAAGRLLVQCAAGESEQLLDVRSGRATPLPAHTLWYRLGTRYVRGNDARERQVLYDISTGVVSRVGRSEVADLDVPGAPGIDSVCPALRSYVRREAAWLTGSLEYAGGVLAHPRGEHGAVEVARCDGRLAVLAGQRVGGGARDHLPRDFDPRGGVLSWDTGSFADTSEGEEAARGPRSFHARLHALSLSSGRLRSWPLPLVAVAGVAARDYYGYSTHTAYEVFWVRTRSVVFGESGPSVQSYSVYSARL
jgi:hypothetical protein